MSKIIKKAKGKSRPKSTASKSAFAQKILTMTMKLKPGKYTGEDIRIMAQKKGIVAAHPNAWGAAIGSCLSGGLLKPTGKYVRPTDPRSHSRPIQVYTKA